MSPDRRCQSGFGLPFAIFVIIVLASIGLALAELSDSGSESVAFDVQSSRAWLTAQSGVDIGINRLLPPGGAANDCTHAYFNTTPSMTFTAQGLEGCSATVACRLDTSGGEDYYTLTSTGTCGAGLDLAERTIQVGIH